MWTRTAGTFQTHIVLEKRLLACAVLQLLSCVRLFATLWAVACQAPLSMGFFRYEYWSGLPLTAFMQLGWSQGNDLHDVIVLSFFFFNSVF